MGHVDHGKTTLLDTLRNSKIAESEFGGITQKIGAFTVDVGQGRLITFIDTPGHAAFSAMRSRGALLTDLVVLVVAVNDGVMPQTIESIAHIKSAGVPMVVALNKIDARNANIAETKEQLFANDVIVEDFGGEITSVEISAKNNLNIDKLLAAINFQTKTLESAKEICAVVLESTIVPIYGKVASVIVTSDILKVGDHVVSSSGVRGKIRTIFDEYGKSLRQATISMPVQISGFSDEIPQAGDKLTMGDKIKGKKVKKSIKTPKIESFEETEYTAIIRCDTMGSCEAIEKILSTYHSKKCALKVISCAVGSVTPKDVEICQFFHGCIFVFNSHVEPLARQEIARVDLPIEEHRVIYHLIDSLLKRIEGKLPLKSVATTLGEAEVMQVFMFGIGKKRVPVAGCRVFSGTMELKSRLRVWRADENGDRVEVFDGDCCSLKKNRANVGVVEKGDECGIRAVDDFAFETGDRVECYHFVDHVDTLDWKPFS